MHEKDGGIEEIMVYIEEKPQKEEKPIWKHEKKTVEEWCVDG
jgi:hypothetical protein